MKPTLSNRLALCAGFVPQGARVADIGADHGYLSIYLLQQGIASAVTAVELREQPLAKARRNARACGVYDRMEFHLADGLRPVAPGTVDAVVIAGMGGDTIAGILADAPWVRDAAYTLILQPQTSGNDLRRWLSANGFGIRREQLCTDGGRIYFAMEARFGGAEPLTPGQEYLSPQLLHCGSDLLPAYFDRVTAALQRTVDGISGSAAETQQARLAYYAAALREIQEMREQYDNGL